MTNKVEIPAVLDKDLMGILKHFDLEEKLKEGALDCEGCLNSLSWDNLGAIMVKGNTLLLYCNLSECIESATHEKK